jgi:hypothetical protein
MEFHFAAQTVIALGQVVRMPGTGERQDTSAPAHQLGEQFSGKNAGAENIGPYK